jgi:aromatic ring-opening dioxygenase LigB subunit
MAEVVAGLASSHAFTFVDPADWEHGWLRNRAMYASRYGAEPPLQPEMEAETPEQVRPRYARLLAGLERVRDELQHMRPDALLVIGDDQNENFTEENVPQFAIYTGDTVRAIPHGQPGPEFRCHSELAEALLKGCVEQGIDLSFARRFPNGELKSHAHCPPLYTLTPKSDIPIIPIFVNAIHPPAPEPARCYAFGRAIRRVLESRPASERVAVYASGGLSHFTAGYPWKSYQGPFSYGAISQEFDARIVELLRAGRGQELSKLTGADLLANGEIEFRAWLIMLGVIGDVPVSDLVYEPFYRANMAMAVGYWDTRASA